MGQCGESNVVQVKRRRTVQGRRERETLWFGQVLDPALTEVLARWIEGGCPGTPPGPLITGMFGPSAVHYRHLDPTLR
jgi:hypothetical protein